MGFARAAVSSKTDQGIPCMPLYCHRQRAHPITHL